MTDFCTMESKSHYGWHILVAGENYTQRSSRQHAALAPKYLGQVAVIALSYARIAWQYLVNFGILPLEFINIKDYDKIEQADMVRFKSLREDIKNRNPIKVLVSND
jgi:aconitate hydratase